MLAAEEGHVAVVELLLGQSAQVDLHDKVTMHRQSSRGWKHCHESNHVLSRLCICENVVLCNDIHPFHEILVMLFVFQEAWTALMFASINDHTAVVQRLLEHSAAVDKKNDVSLAIMHKCPLYHAKHRTRIR